MPQDRPVQPKLADLLAGYLSQRADAQVAGLTNGEAEVVPYEAGPVHPIDAGLAWHETLAVAKCTAAELDVHDWQAPPQWANLVAAHEPVVALACALGNFPQLVRHFHTLLQSQNLGQLRPSSPGPGRAPSAAPALVDWADKVGKQFTKNAPGRLLLAVGTLRLAKQFDAAEKLFNAHDAQVSKPWRAVWDNERASLAWHRGQAEQACELWQRLEPTAVVLFNRGMANLFLDRPAQAQPSLEQAARRLPEDGAWHHLARLYLTLAKAR